MNIKKASLIIGCVLLCALNLFFVIFNLEYKPNEGVELVSQGQMVGMIKKVSPSPVTGVKIPLSGMVETKVKQGNKVTKVKTPVSGTSTITDDGNSITNVVDFVIEPIEIEQEKPKYHTLGAEYYKKEYILYYKINCSIFYAGVDYNINANEFSGKIGVEIKF